MVSRPVHAGAVMIAVALLAMAGCARKTVARVPSPPLPARIGSTETGIASWYGIPYHGRRAASGEIYDMEKLTAAHRTLPFDTWVEVTNLSNGKRVDVRINDRGPFVSGRIIDLSHAAARQISMLGPGIAKVRLEVITRPSAPPHSEPEPQPSSAPPVPNAAPVPNASPVSPTPAIARPAEADRGETNRAEPRDVEPGDVEPGDVEPGDVESNPNRPGTNGAPNGVEPRRRDPNSSDPTAEPLPSGESPVNPLVPQTSPRVIPPASSPDANTTGSMVRPPTRSSRPGFYVVQAGAFADRGRAESLQSSLSKKFGAARVVRGPGDPPLWRVLVGREMTPSDATDLAARVRASGSEAAVVPEP